jgi:hypothetical protein
MAKDAREEIDRALELLELAHANVRNGDWLGALRCFGALPDHCSEACMAIVQKAYDGGTTKKAIAQAIGMPPSGLRGLEKTARP